MPGHRLLARLGKRVLRPGGRELTRAMLDQAGLAGADVVELAPGLGRTAAEIVALRPRSYRGVDRSPEAVQATRLVVAALGDVHVADASATGLPDASADVVVGEAMLTMQSDAAKAEIVDEAARLLRPGGRYAIHELGLTSDDIAEQTKTDIRQGLARSIRVNARRPQAGPLSHRSNRTAVPGPPPHSWDRVPFMRWERIAAGVVAGVLACLSAGVATGQTAGTPAVVNDRAGDTTPNSTAGLAAGVGDIRRAVVTSTGERRVRVTVTLAAATPAEWLFVNIQVVRQLFQVRNGSLYRVSTFEVEGFPARLVTRGPVRTGPRRIAVDFDGAAFGRATVMRWQVDTRRALSPVDAAPDRGMAVHRLAPPRPARTLQSPAQVTPGRPATFTARGFPAGTNVTLIATPTRFIGGNGVGIAVPRSFRTNAQGTAAMRFSFPARYQSCVGRSCQPRSWTRGERVTVDACASTRASGLVCARTTTRIAP